MTTPAADPQVEQDQRVYLHDVSWSGYQQLLAMRGESAVPRITFLRGTVELMSPSGHHEITKKMIARLVEAWADEKSVTLNGYGSWTIKTAARKRGLEPDECYILDNIDKPRPDLAIEVVWTSGGLDKFEVYRGLEVPEVWVWQTGVIEVFALVDGQYEKVSGSRLLPDLDLVHLTTFLGERDQTAAVAAYRRELRERS